MLNERSQPKEYDSTYAKYSNSQNRFLLLDINILTALGQVVSGRGREGRCWVVMVNCFLIGVLITQAFSL